MSEKGYISIESFLQLQEECRKLQRIIDDNKWVSKREEGEKYYYDSRYGWIKEDTRRQNNNSGVVTAEEIERNFEILSIRLDKH